MFMVWIERQKLCGWKVLDRWGKIALGHPGTPESLRFGNDQPPVFSQDDVFFFHLLDQTAEVLGGEGKQLGHFPMFQGNRYLDSLFGLEILFVPDHLPEKFLQPQSPGKTTFFADA